MLTDFVCAAVSSSPDPALESLHFPISAGEARATSGSAGSHTPCWCGARWRPSVHVIQLAPVITYLTGVVLLQSGAALFTGGIIIADECQALLCSLPQSSEDLFENSAAVALDKYSRSNLLASLQRVATGLSAAAPCPCELLLSFFGMLVSGRLLDHTRIACCLPHSSTHRSPSGPEAES